MARHGPRLVEPGGGRQLGHDRGRPLLVLPGRAAWFLRAPCPGYESAASPTRGGRGCCRYGWRRPAAPRRAATSTATFATSHLAWGRFGPPPPNQARLLQGGSGPEWGRGTTAATAGPRTPLSAGPPTRSVTQSDGGGSGPQSPSVPKLSSNNKAKASSLGQGLDGMDHRCCWCNRCQFACVHNAKRKPNMTSIFEILQSRPGVHVNCRRSEASRRS